MRIGIPRETKNQEDRVAITPPGVHQLVLHGHDVVLEHGAGVGSRIPDAEYEQAGARMVPVEEAWGADMVLKVKEPTPAEYQYLRADMVLFTYLHLAASEELTRALVDAGTTALAYENVETDDGALPLLAPMSEVAGRMAALVGSHLLLSTSGGRGILMPGIPGVRPAVATVIGAGNAGSHALDQLVGLGAEVTVLDLSIPALRRVDEKYGGRVRTVVSSPYEIEKCVLRSDVVIGAVLIPGRKAPTVVPHDLVERMMEGSVVVDIAVDQGGCCEDTRATSHDAPTFRVGPTTFYCVANMPGAVPVTSTYGLTNATLPYATRLADAGWRKACAADAALRRGVVVAGGRVQHPAIAAEFPGLPVA
ncbi:MAG: alanine dehydrogenase [Kocuria sp.]|nr:alanine dehydrogenase [Kocuria sp.]